MNSFGVGTILAIICMVSVHIAHDGDVFTLKAVNDIHSVNQQVTTTEDAR